MDWVKPKKERTAATAMVDEGEAGGQIKKMSATSKTSSTASAWLESLCQENIAFLQQSLPVVRPARGRSRPVRSVAVLATTLQWGVGTLEAEIEEGSEVLHRLTQVLANILIVPGDSIAAETNQAAASQLQLKTSENIARWLIRCLPVHGSDPYVAVSSVGWVHGLRELGRELTPSLWLEVLQSILTQIDRAWSDPKPSSMFPWLLWACEAPVALATQLIPSGRKDRMVVEALDRLAKLLESVVADPTPWLARGARNVRALLASVIRTRWAANKLGVREWNKKQQRGLAQLTEIALGLTATDGRPMLVDWDLGADEPDLWQALVELCPTAKTLPITLQAVMENRSERRRLPRKDIKATKTRTISRKLLGEPGRYFEKAEMATMRRTWEQSGCRLAIDFARDPMWLDCLGSGGRRLLSGEWDIAIRKDGRLLETDVAWSEVCWFSDDDVDYLELEAAVEHECKVQRQLILIREEGLMLFADALLAEHAAHWSIESSWELAPDIDCRSAEKSHEAELFLRDDPATRQALLLPLSLPEWRRQPSGGKLYEELGRLILRHETQGKRLYSPLALVSRKSLRDLPFTWRRLTVAEDLVIQPAEVAQAFRLQLGAQQLVFYRSLAQPVRRSALGLHLNSEFYAGRFDSEDTAYEAIVEISSDE
jgi:hypothetical protein